MADKDFDPSGSDPQEDPEAQASGSDPQEDPVDERARNEQGETPQPTAEGDELTVDDILGAPQSAEAAAEDAVLADLESTLLNDLKRLQAEYANYRRRTEDQREIEIERARGAAAKALIPVLDDLDRAEKHGDLEEGTAFTAIAEKVRGVAEKMGMTAYGAAGEAFDPQQHEAIFQAPTPGVEVATVLEVVEVGYRLGETELRPAKVVVAVPAE